MENCRRIQIGGPHTFGVVDIAGFRQGHLRTGANGGARIGSDEVGAQSADDNVGVVIVQPVEDEAVVQKSRSLMEDLTGRIGIDPGRCSATASAVAMNCSNAGPSDADIS